MGLFPCGEVKVDPTVLVRIGHALLVRVVKVYQEAGIPLPARRVWTMGEAVFDCEELVVSFTGLEEGLVTGDSPPDPCNYFMKATFKITVVRCAPMSDSQGNPPSPKQLADAVDKSVIDAYLLMRSACKLDMWGAEIPGVDPSATGGMGVEASIEVAEAQGGMQGVTLTLTTLVG